MKQIRIPGWSLRSVDELLARSGKKWCAMLGDGKWIKTGPHPANHSVLLQVRISRIPPYKHGAGERGIQGTRARSALGFGPFSPRMFLAWKGVEIP